MKVAITQPTCLPWLGYFELIAQVDAFVFLDSVQFEKQSWQSRNKIRSNDGRLQWLSAPVMNAPLDTAIKDIDLAPNAQKIFNKQHRTIRQELGKAPYFHEAEGILSEHFDLNLATSNLADFNIRFIEKVTEALGVKPTKFFRSSALQASGHREELLIRICEELGGDFYYSNAGSASYLEEARSKFENAGIELAFQNWEHPTYPQLCEPFESHLSCVDAIASVGLEKCRKFIEL